MDLLLAPILATFVVDTLLLGGLAWAYHAPSFADARISHRKNKLPRQARLTKMASASVISLVMVLGGTYTFVDTVIVATPTSPLTIALQAIAVLLVYDFAYYAFHRGMHHKRVMKRVHGVHHRAKNPSALESFYLHPLELVGGLSLLFASTWLVGPVHPYAFALAFFVYSTLNIIIHAGVRLRTMPLRPLDFLIRKHHVHHHDDFGKNYSSLTPLPDLVFGTAG